MILILFLTVALVNLLVGIAMALAWEWLAQPVETWFRFGKAAPHAEEATAEQSESTDEDASEIADDPAAEDSPDAPSLEECVPQKWLEILAENAVEARSFVEATAQVLRLKIIPYRESLAQFEDQIRRLPADADPADMEALILKLIALNGDWLEAQSEAMGALVDRQDSHAALASIATRLEDVLLEQHALIETSRLQLEMMQESTMSDRGTVVIEIQKMLDCAHRLRDLMHQSLATILSVEGRYDEGEEAWQIDALCKLANRTGIETQIQQWRASQHAAQRESSLVLFDLDHFSALNGRVGTRLADQLLREVSILLNSTLRKERGFDRLGRYSGQQFVALLGGTPPDRAFIAADRLRQIVERARFRCGEAEYSLELSCAVLELPAEEPLPAILDRLEQTLASAKSHGYNCTYLANAEAAEYQQPRPFKGDTLQIELDQKYDLPELILEPAEV